MTHTPLGVCRAVSRSMWGMSMFLKDWSELDENVLTQALQTVKSLAELSGVANRRRVLQNPNLSTWSEAQKQIILQRKYELERYG